MYTLSSLAVLLPLVGFVKAGELFTVNCQPLTIQRSDPIISPGVASSHVHVVIGGTGFKRTESNQDAINSKATTCDKKLDKSSYWQPQLYHQNTDGSFNLVTMQGSAVYYLNRACDYAAGKTTCDATKYPRAPPAGLRMITGNPTLRTFNASDPAQRAIAHMCLLADTSREYNSLPTEACLRLRAETFFPSCWDGQNLDSSDHKSHMAFPAIGDYNFGVCPQSHPVAIYSVFYEFFYDTSKIQDFNKLVYAMGDPTGYGLHGDFINGWSDQNALNNAMATCTGAKGTDDPACSLVVNGSAGSASSQVPDTAEPIEDVGKNGNIAKLPGDNPVTGTFPKSNKMRRAA